MRDVESDKIMDAAEKATRHYTLHQEVFFAAEVVLDRAIDEIRQANGDPLLHERQLVNTYMSAAKEHGAQTVERMKSYMGVLSRVVGRSCRLSFGEPEEPPRLKLLGDAEEPLAYNSVNISRVLRSGLAQSIPLRIMNPQASIIPRLYGTTPVGQELDFIPGLFVDELAGTSWSAISVPWHAIDCFEFT